MSSRSGLRFIELGSFNCFFEHGEHDTVFFKFGIALSLFLRNGMVHVRLKNAPISLQDIGATDGAQRFQAVMF